MTLAYAVTGLSQHMATVRGGSKEGMRHSQRRVGTGNLWEGYQ